MSYNFTFDLSRFSQALFKEIAEFSERGQIHERISDIAKELVKKFKVEQITGLSLDDAITLISDLINIQLKNCVFKDHFGDARNKALFLPHCCRKYMDSRCKAEFNHEISFYICRHCSKDCTVNIATQLAKKEHYDVYVLPGGSCVRKILKRHTYDGVVGVACTDELKLAAEILKQWNMPAQGIPLIKNGCSRTRFNMETLRIIIEAGNKSQKKWYT
jgi:hypothetical protein